MSFDDNRPLSEVPLEELKARLEALRARRAQPRGTSATRTPGVIGPGETTPRRGGSKRRATMEEMDIGSIFDRVLNKEGSDAPSQ